MTFAAALAVILTVAVASAAAAYLVWRALDLDARRRHHEVGNPTNLQIGVVLAVLLAFVFNEVWGEYNLAAQAVLVFFVMFAGALALSTGRLRQGH